MRRELVITSAVTNRDAKSLDKYFNEIKGYDLLSQQEEVDLPARIRRGDQQALERMIQGNLRFVVSVAKQYQNLGIPLGDLINEGNIGLIKAVTEFDETKGFKFISYAVWWIRQTILSGIHTGVRHVQIPLNISSTYNQMKEPIRDLLQELGREPTIDEIAAKSGLSPKKIAHVLRSYKFQVSTDEPISNEDGAAARIDYISDVRFSPSGDTLNDDFWSVLYRSLQDVTNPRERYIFCQYFGINAMGSGKSYDDIAISLGLTRERIRGLLNKVKGKLKRSELRFQYASYLADFEEQEVVRED